MARTDRELLEEALAQNRVLIDALVANQPVEVIRALNPPVAGVQRKDFNPYAGEPDPSPPLADPWADPDVSNEALIAQYGKGWVAAMEQENVPEVGDVPGPE